MLNYKYTKVLIVAVLTAFSGSAASAQTSDPAAQDVSFTVAPYLWLAGITSKTTLGGHTVSSSQSLGDIVKASETVFGFSGYGDVRVGPWAFFLDGLYTRMTDDPALRGQFLVDLKVESAILDFGVSYRFSVMGKPSSASDWAVYIEPYAGGRYTSMTVSIRGQRAGIIDVSRTFSGVDPIFGGRLSIEQRDGWRIQVNADVGGFGAHSNFTWSAAGLVGYRLEMFGIYQTVSLGYKAVGVDIDNTRNGIYVKMNQITHGPVLNTTFKF